MGNALSVCLQELLWLWRGWCLFCGVLEIEVLMERRESEPTKSTILVSFPMSSHLQCHRPSLAWLSLPFSLRVLSLCCWMKMAWREKKLWILGYHHGASCWALLCGNIASMIHFKILNLKATVWEMLAHADKLSTLCACRNLMALDL